ncbi:2-hydroxyacid dehydrogenase [Pseudomonas sp. Marseille-QA0892]
MTRPVILQMCALSPKLDADLAERYEVIRGWEAPDQAALVREQGDRIVGIATAAPTGVPADLLQSLPALKVVSCRGVGLDKIDLSIARDRGIQVSGTFGTLNDCVADLAFALVLDVARHLSAADRYVRAGKWQQARYPLTTSVYGKRLGIVGLGQIGQQVARRASGFDMEIAYCSRRPVDGVGYRHEPSLRALAQWCDFLVVTVAGSAETRHLIDADVLRALGSEGYLINVARGLVVDEAALVSALTERQIAGAGLDVFEDEPNVPAALLELDNVVLAPHMASGTRETRAAMEALTLENLERFFSEGKVKTPAF